jgi:N-acetyltransferase
MLVRGGEVRDSAWYAITETEWPAVRANLQRRISQKR